MSALEELPTTWDPDRDECFFRIVARLLPPAMVEAASSLLASYDGEDVPQGRQRPVRYGPAPGWSDGDVADERRRATQAPTGRETA